MHDESKDPTVSEIVSAGIKLGAEAIVPGGSNLVKGNIGVAAAHALIGFGGKALFGFPGLIAVSLNSLSTAFTGRGLLSHLGFARTKDDNVLRVVAKEGVKTGIRIQRGVRTAGARATEGFRDLVAEANSELDQDKNGGADQP